jgi:hypothetical protein
MNPILSMFGNYQNFQQQFANFQQQMNGIDPRQKIQELLNSGQMSQQQFNNLRFIVNQMTGRNI